MTEEDDALAAEYVLGTLDDRAAAARRVATDPAFAVRVAEWEMRLSALNGEFADVPAPDLLPAIEARVFGRPPRRWRLWGLGGLVGASVAVFVVLGPLRPDAVRTRLTAPDQALVVEASVTPGADGLRLVQVAGPAAPSGQAYQGWIIRPGAAPESLGLLTGAPLQAPVAGLPPGTIVAISLEPEGGSPTGQPTGPVILQTPLNI
ncbi:anti-sigma factor [Falsirhodobacter sp. 20TX0035]|uniref:anti-sigma factor n=1 Tax=Falsirhodobacter sp. 20TX0035 TaxID=3022019 RepID=UPI00232B559D|nr:anti-sigma factor [Falsirhodobacter sp. 20TX0035]MDB6452613.1 anti-sigma factor [Falsirhodobacter sp. 20TX0035]